MHLSHDGLTLRYGTPDTPAPPDVVAPGVAPSLTVAVQPPSPANAVDVLYWVDDGAPRSLTAWESRTDYKSGTQYFRTKFPQFLRGKRVDYCPVVSCGGRQVPSPGAERQLMSTFIIRADRTSREAALREPPDNVLVPRFTASLQSLAQVTIQLQPPVHFGETPEGLRLDFHVQGGEMRGRELDAAILQESTQYLNVSPNGMATTEIHAIMKADTGELLSTTMIGKVDFGPDGHARLAAGSYPERAPLHMMVNISTGDPRWDWLNRASVVAIGQARLEALTLEYDLFLLENARARQPHAVT
ncbi:MAG TPA: DUF3237 family protein [Polyangiaceae bacterium]|nr:DUF3237 family protein [Polyangiaceae bacterium]